MPEAEEPVVEKREPHERVSAGPPEEHNHYWTLIGHQGQRWRNKGHGVAVCLRCSAMTLVHYGKLGPCEHVVSQKQAQVEPMTLEWERCERCGGIVDEAGNCTGCGCDQGE